uniref:(northern house mosquito) hypothetical protein n=1 Tax=Culex pipiens TaxID=7175 RepID=A0A8D8AWG4_CULPI
MNTGRTAVPTTRDYIWTLRRISGPADCLRKPRKMWCKSWLTNRSRRISISFAPRSRTLPSTGWTASGASCPPIRTGTGWSLSRPLSTRHYPSTASSFTRRKTCTSGFAARTFRTAQTPSGPRSTLRTFSSTRLAKTGSTLPVRSTSIST